MAGRESLGAAVLGAYGWADLLSVSRVAHGNDAPAAGQTREDSKRAFCRGGAGSGWWR